MTAVAIDISARHQWQQMLNPAPQALPGRQAFHERLERALSHGVPTGPVLAVLSMDLGGVRHDDGQHRRLGDDAMRIVAARLMLALRVQDAACRVGEQAFACLLVDAIDHDHLGARAGRLFDAVAAPLRLGGVELQTRPSIGIAMYPADGATGARLLRRADAARLRARQKQQSYAFFDRQADI